MAKKQSGNPEDLSVDEPNPGTAAQVPAKPILAVGDVVLIRGKVVNVQGQLVIVATNPVTIPGSVDYTQQILLHNLQVEKA